MGIRNTLMKYESGLKLTSPAICTIPYHTNDLSSILLVPQLMAACLMLDFFTGFSDVGHEENFSRKEVFLQAEHVNLKA
jgi:hypothetical protein